MHTPTNSVFALVPSRSQADQILRRLKTAGFSTNDISALFPSPERRRGSESAKPSRKPQRKARSVLTPPAWSAALQGGFATIGALAFPGTGPLVASGPIIFALIGAGAGASVGGIAGGLISLGIVEAEARRYEEKIKEGCILIFVHTHNLEGMSLAEAIFTEVQAGEIRTTGRPLPVTDRSPTEYAPHLTETVRVPVSA